MESFKKRQKEIQRQERQRDKAAKRMERKLQRAGEGSSQDPAAPTAEEPATDRVPGTGPASEE
jgi:hypothetical protein